MSAIQSEQICAAVETALSALVPATVKNAWRQYPYSAADTALPALNVVMGADKPLGERGPDNLSFQDWELTVFVDVIVKSSATPLETTLNNIRLAVHKTLLANYTLGLPFVFNGYAGPVEEPEQKGETELPISVMRTSFMFLHRSLITDPSTL